MPPLLPFEPMMGVVIVVPGLPPKTESPTPEAPALWPDAPAATQKAPKLVALLLVPMAVGMLPPGVTGTLFFLA